MKSKTKVKYVLFVGTISIMLLVGLVICGFRIHTMVDYSNHGVRAKAIILHKDTIDAGNYRYLIGYVANGETIEKWINVDGNLCAELDSIQIRYHKGDSSEVVLERDTRWSTSLAGMTLGCFILLAILIVSLAMPETVDRYLTQEIM